MRVFLKLFLILLIVAGIGVFGVGSSKFSIDGFLTKILSDGAVVENNKSQNSLKSQPVIDFQKNDIANVATLNQLSDSAATERSLNNIFINKTIENNLPEKSGFTTGSYLPDFISLQKQPSSLAGIDGTGGIKPSKNQVSGIDGTGGVQPQPHPDRGSGIDGTGGPRPQVSDTIEGTGGPQLPQETGPDKEGAEVVEIDGTGGPQIIAWGTLQQVGNDLVVNGIKFTTDNNTQTTIDGNSDANVSELRAGQVVIISGVEPKSIDNDITASDSYVAEQITYTTQISGEITPIAEDNSLMVLGQKVVLHDAVIFGGTATAFSDLVRGDHVNVSGFRLSDGSLSATRIDRIHDEDESTIKDKVSGTVSYINESKQTFQVNGLTINYDGLANVPVLTEGMYVAVQGETDSLNQVLLDADVLNASTSILRNSVEDIDSDVEKVDVKVEGFITDLTFFKLSDNGLVTSGEKTGRFNLNIGNTKILGDLATQYEGGDYSNFALDTKIEVEGYLNEDNVLVAKRVKFLVASLTDYEYGAWTVPLLSATKTFSWTDVDAKAYRLVLRYGEADIFYDEIFDGNTISVEVSGLPRNSACFYAFLYTQQDEYWSRKYYTYCGTGEIADSKLESHVNGSEFSGTSETFEFSPITGAEKYRLVIYDYYNHDIEYHDETYTEFPETVIVDNLPENGTDIRLFLYTKQKNTGWAQKSYYFKSYQNPALKNAALILNSDTDKHVLSGSTETFSWEDVNADQYQVTVFKQAMGDWRKFYEETFEGPETSVTLHDLPLNSAEIIFRLRTKHGGGWGTKNYTFTGPGLVPEAELISHKNGDTLSSSTETFEWSEVPGAEEYRLTFHNVVYKSRTRFFEDFDGSVSSGVITGLPKNNTKIQITLSTKHNNYWAHKVYYFYSAAGLANASFNSHSWHQTVTTPSIKLAWDDVSADSYHLVLMDMSTDQQLYKRVFDGDITSVVIDQLPQKSLVRAFIATQHGDWLNQNTLEFYTDIPQVPSEKQEELLVSTLSKTTVVSGTFQRINDKVIVNDVEFTTSDSTKVFIDGVLVSGVSKLMSGQVVVVKGRINEANRGVAEEIRLNSQLIGPISYVDQGHSITVLGQKVTAHEDGSIFFDRDKTFFHLKEGEIVSISGFKKANDTLAATRVRWHKEASNRVVGLVSQLDESDKTFVVNELIVDYSSVDHSPVLSDGKNVSIKGKLNTQGQFQASLIEAESLGLHDNIDTIILEGFVTRFDNLSDDFSIGHTPVSVGSDTEFIAMDRNDLLLNHRIEVRGYLNSNGMLVAEKVTFVKSDLISHQYGQVFDSPTQTFVWSNVKADAYRLYIQYADGPIIFNQTFDKDTTSITVDGLPKNNALVYAYLSTKQGDFWLRNTYKFNGTGEIADSELTSHAYGSALKGTTETFTFSSVEGAEAYRLLIHDHYDSSIVYHDEEYSEPPESVTVENLPQNGSGVKLFLSTKLDKNSGWSTKYYYVTSYHNLALKNASLSSHADKQTLNNSTETFTWDNVGAEEYHVSIFNRSITGGFQTLYEQSVDASETSITVDNLPETSGEIVFRLRTNHGDGWAIKDYTFVGVGSVTEAELTSHSDGDTLLSSTEFFVWTPVDGAEAYRLTFHNVVFNSAAKIVADFDGNISSARITGLPENNAEIQATLSSKYNGHWTHKNYTFYGSSKLATAHFTSHSWQQIVTQSPIKFTWNDVNADSYHFSLIDIATSKSLYSQDVNGEITSIVIDQLPQKSSLRPVIMTRHGDWWSYDKLEIHTNISERSDESLESESDDEKTSPSVFTNTITVKGAFHRVDDVFVVNGVNFVVDDSISVFIDGEEVSGIEKLMAGQVVVVKGRVDDLNNGVAEEITHTTQVSGPISQIGSGSSITVLGQEIVAHEYQQILFDRYKTAYHLKKGDFISVSGFKQADGVLGATRIRWHENIDNKVVGLVSGLNEVDTTFMVNKLTVNYGAVNDLPVLNNGVNVFVQGEMIGETELQATAITREELNLDSAIDKISLEGFITELDVLSGRFTIGDKSVLVDALTEFIGKDRDSLLVNSRIEVEGYVNNDGVFVAEKVIYMAAEIFSHKHKQLLSSSTQTFEWHDVKADAYRLHIVDAENSIFYSQDFDGDTTSATISGLPENSSGVRVYLHTKQGEFWLRKYYEFSGSREFPNSVITSPNYGDTLQSTTETFTFSRVLGAEAYRVHIYDYLSGTDYFDQTFTEPKPITLTDLPNSGADINVSLYTKHNGWWAKENYTFKSVEVLKNAKLTSHIDKQKLSSSTETFVWEDVGAEAYQILLSRNNGAEKLGTLNFDGSTTSVTLDNLPVNGGEIRIKLRTKHQAWGTVEYNFYGTGEIFDAELVSHNNHGKLLSTTETFTWSEVLEAEEYSVTIQQYPYTHTVRHYKASETSGIFDGLPKNGARIHLILGTKVNGYWVRKYYRLHGVGELEDAAITSHIHRERVTTPSVELIWNDVDADEYILQVLDVSTGRIKLHRQNYSTDVVSKVINDLPNNSLLEVTIFTRHGDWWGDSSILLSTDIPE